MAQQDAEALGGDEAARTPASLTSQYDEYLPGVMDMVQHAQNPLMAKVVQCLSILCIEVDNLTRKVDSQFFDPLILFGDDGRVEEEETPEEGECETQLSRLLHLLKDLYDLVKKIYQLTKNMLYQLNSVFRKKTYLYENLFKKAVLFEFFDKLGQALVSVPLHFLTLRPCS